MKLLFIAGLFCLVNCFYVNGENQDFLLSSQNPEKIKKFLCVFFPKYVKSDCSENESFSDRKLEISAEMDIHIHVKTGATNDGLNEKGSDDKNCQKCKAIVRIYEKFINKKLSANFVQQQMFAVCAVYKNPVYNNCVKFYKTIGFQIIKAILRSEDPKKVCQILHLCGKTGQGIQDQQFLDLLMTLARPRDSDKCKSCVNAVKLFEKTINNSMNAVQIQHKLFHGCNILVERARVSCIVFYVTSGFQMIKDILRKVDPKKICQNLHYCRRVENDLIAPAVEKPIKTISSIPPDAACALCVGNVYAYEITINRSLSVTDIQKVSLDVCQMFNSDVKKNCIAFFNGVGLEVIKAILKSENPVKICQLMNICIKKFGDLGQKSFLDLFLITLLNKYNSCDLCKYSVAFYEKSINMSQTPEQVQQKFLAVCSIQNTPYKEQCTSFYKGQGFEFIKSLLKKEDPQAVCHKQGVCKSNLKAHELKPSFSENLQNLDSNLKSIECFVCKEIMMELAKILEIPISKEGIIKALNQVCGAFPHEWKGKCHHFIHKYSDQIVSFIMNNINLKEICSLLQLCSNEAVRQDDNLYFLPKFTYGLD